MYAAIRHYRVSPSVSGEVIDKILEDFAPSIVEGVQGLLAYFVVEAEEGAFATVTVCDSQEDLEECSIQAAEWMKRYLTKSILGTEDLSDFLFEVGPTLRGLVHTGAPSLVHTGAPKATNDRFPLGAKGPARSEQSQGLEGLLSPAEVSKALGMGKSWVYQRIRSGEIRSVRLGNNIKVERQDLQEYLESQRRRRPNNE
jgi:excisionase family DNA binding protein